MCVSMTICLCVSLVVDWQNVQNVPHLSPEVRWDQCQHPAGPTMDKQHRKYMENQ